MPAYAQIWHQFLERKHSLLLTKINLCNTTITTVRISALLFYHQELRQTHNSEQRSLLSLTKKHNQRSAPYPCRRRSSLFIALDLPAGSCKFLCHPQVISDEEIVKQNLVRHGPQLQPKGALQGKQAGSSEVVCIIHLQVHNYRHSARHTSRV